MTTLELPSPAATEERARRWSWQSGTCVAVQHNFQVRVEPGGGDFRRVLRPLVTPFEGFVRTDEAVPVRRYDVVADDSWHLPFSLRYENNRLASGKSATDLVGMLAWHINQSVIQHSIADFVLLHAAAAVRAGVTVILPADQESGKTTTVAGLLREGFDYVTDEAVAINPTTRWLTPFPKTLSLDPGSWPLFPECGQAHATPWARQWHVPADHLGARAVRTAVPPPRVIVFPKYVAGATTKLVPLSRGEAVRDLAQTTFEFPRYARRNLQTLTGLVSRAKTARLVIGSLDSAVMAIEALVSETLMEELCP